MNTFSGSQCSSRNNWHRIVTLTVLCLFGFCLMCAVASPYKQKKRQKTDERVYLVHADELKYDQYSSVPDAQIVKGKVHFTHAGSQRLLIATLSLAS